MQRHGLIALLIAILYSLYSAVACAAEPPVQLGKPRRK